ncbi:ankyrin repeats (3 copies) domain-containing protein [Trichoderma breve]|uniref:Ankyrin repeats (3 copies) domain-containing protein n=1 Tax=Trichoderma breve TaxID=2034170 RepID=A0A9W9B9Z2_9HYPO|nr:ankyrin repeats (3 copies) domain-containing protein [Trichoderma breve]KAJ4856500.1 ankyrin repeats (3 copies) domain-containing protein [Trichoderma breve]
MAPMGILTAIVSAIRVCGSPSLRAFIGRAQEGGGNAEAELCSSTSRDVCELYNNGGIARVFGRPKILEVVYDPEHNFTDDKAGIYTFQEFIEKNSKKWTRIQPPESPGSPDNKEAMSDAFSQNFSPNLSLNVGIKRKPPLIFLTVAITGMVLQAGVLVFAVLTTYYLRWEKDGSHPESYACPLTITGTLLLCGGIFLCAFLVGESTKEQVFRRNPDSGDKNVPREALYWVQPGGQVLGDQVFDAFCCSDHMEPLQEYITSWKNQSKISQIVVWAAVGISVTGFVMQFVGLRAIHSAVSVAQLGAIMLMSAARAALRMQRLKPEDNFLAQCPDEVVGHELDWLAIRFGEQDFQGEPKHSSPTQDSRAYPRLLWRFRAYRTRLAQLTQSQNTETKGTGSAENFDVRLVEVRETAHCLALAIESAVNTIFSKSPEIGDKWRDALSMFWSFASEVAIVERSGTSKDPPILHTVYLKLTREELTTPWKLENKLELEGLLGLWVWSLKSDPAVEVADSQSHFTISRATEIPRQRIVSTNKNIATDLEIWLGGKIPIITKYELDPTSVQRGDPGITKWKLGDKQGKEIRFFAWHATETSRGTSPDLLSVMSAHTDSTLLSMCAQEVFGSFVASILKILDDIGDIDIQEIPSFHLENTLVTEMVKLFTETQLGSNEDALLCILPLMIPRLRLSSTENAVVAAKRIAIKQRKAGKWAQAETMLRWAWALLHEDEPTQQAAIALGELYRWAMRDNQTKEFGLRGIEWLSCQVPSRQAPSPSAHDAIVARYNDVAKRVVQHGNDLSIIRLHMFSENKDESTDEYTDEDSYGIGDSSDETDDTEDDSSEISQTEDDLSGTLLYITLPIPMTDKEKGKVLGLAAKHGWTEVVLAMLELGAEPDFKDPAHDSRTALSQAARNGRIKTMKELMDWGAFPNAQDANYRTPLSHASEMGHSYAVQILLGDQRVDPNAKDRKKFTPLLWAAKNGHEAAVKLLVEGGKVDLNGRNYNGNTPLTLAAIHGSEAIVKLLVEYGADIHRKGTAVLTSLAHAAQNGHEAVVLLLAEEGADVNARDDEGYTPLMLATLNGHAAVVELLVQKGADLEARTEDYRRWTALIHAAFGGHEAIVELLVQSGADINATDKDGRTALTYAAEKGYETIVKLLAQGGAD